MTTVTTAATGPTTGPTTLPAMLAARAAAEPGRTALAVHGVGALTFAGWHARADRLAAGLCARGIRPGDRVALHFAGRDWLDFAVAYIGTQLAGAVAVPCSDRLAPAGLRYLLRYCGVTGLLTSDAATAPADVNWVSTVDDCDAEPVPLPPVDPADLAQLLYTSGTTGMPKAVAASHLNLAYGAATDPRRRPLAHSEYFLHAFPFGTNAGQTMLRTALDARPTALTLPQFTPTRFARTIESYRVGTVFLVPAMAIELLHSGLLARHDTTRVRLVGSTGAALPPAVAVRLAEAFPAATIVNYYTSTEAAPAQTTMIVDPDRPGSVGRSVDGAVRIADETGRPVPAGSVGEVWLRSPHPRHYFREPASSRDTFRDGWVRMGDLGRLDADGYLYVVDRQQDVIKSGSYKVSTLQVEAALHEHPDVVEAAAVGLPHPVLGLVVGAVLASRSALTLPQVRAFLTDRLAPHELPAALLLVDRLPRNAAGKVRKTALVDWFAGRAVDNHNEVTVSDTATTTATGQPRQPTNLEAP